jgi:hypothetical protein
MVARYIKLRRAGEMHTRGALDVLFRIHNRRDALLIQCIYAVSLQFLYTALLIQWRLVLYGCNPYAQSSLDSTYTMLYRCSPCASHALIQ